MTDTWFRQNALRLLSEAKGLLDDERVAEVTGGLGGDAPPDADRLIDLLEIWAYENRRVFELLEANMAQWKLARSAEPAAGGPGGASGWRR